MKLSTEQNVPDNLPLGCGLTKQQAEQIYEQGKEAVEHIIHRDFCPVCDKIVEPVITEALPNSSIGNGILVLSA